MRIDDLTVEVRDGTLKRVGMVPSSLVKLTVTPVHNGVGSWSLTLPAEHELASALREPGAGIIVTGPSDVIASGPTTSPSLTAGADDPLGLVTVSGVTDDVLLADALAWPQPSNADVSSQSVGYDTRLGIAETVMRAYVDANIGPGAPSARRGLLAQKLTLAPDLGRGPTVVKTARFPTLGELLSEIAAYSGLGFRVVQRGAALVFEVYTVSDRSKFIRLDIHNGGLSSQTVEVSPPGVTRVIVAGQGEGADRTLLARSTAASAVAEAAWGRRIEVFKDQRNTDDLTELQQAGDEILADKGFTATNVKAIPAESTSMAYLRDYREGDRITVVVEGQETQATVTQATVVADKDGVLVGIGIGDVSGFDAQSAQARRVDDTAKRVSELERNVEVRSTVAPVMDSALIGTSGPISSTTSVVSPGSTWVWTPAASGQATVRAELDIMAIAAGWSAMYLSIQIDGAWHGQATWFEAGSARDGRILDSLPFLVEQGVPRTVRLMVAQYSGTGRTQVNPGVWRSSII